MIDKPRTDDGKADPLAEFNALMEFGEPGSVAAYVERLVKELRDWESSFNLYDKAQRELNKAYAAAHPEEADIAMHDAGKVSRWAADLIAKLTARDTFLTEEIQKQGPLALDLMKARAEIERLKGYAQHKPPCPAESCRICNGTNDARVYGGSLRGSRADDGDCTNDKHGLHAFEPLDCTCGLST